MTRLILVIAATIGIQTPASAAMQTFHPLHDEVKELADTRARLDQVSDVHLAEQTERMKRKAAELTRRSLMIPIDASDLAISRAGIDKMDLKSLDKKTLEEMDTFIEAQDRINSEATSLVRQDRVGLMMDEFDVVVVKQRLSTRYRALEDLKMSIVEALYASSEEEN